MFVFVNVGLIQLMNVQKLCTVNLNISRCVQNCNQFDSLAQVEILEQDVSKSSTTASGELCVIISLTTMTQTLPATCSDSGICCTFVLFLHHYWVTNWCTESCECSKGRKQCALLFCYLIHETNENL